MAQITANAWTLAPGDKIVKGIFQDCTVVRVTDDGKNYSRIWYTRDTNFLHNFTTAHNNSFTIEPVS